MRIFITKSVLQFQQQRFQYKFFHSCWVATQFEKLFVTIKTMCNGRFLYCSSVMYIWLHRPITTTAMGTARLPNLFCSHAHYAITAASYKCILWRPVGHWGRAPLIHAMSDLTVPIWNQLIRVHSHSARLCLWHPFFNQTVVWKFKD